MERLAYPLGVLVATVVVVRSLRPRSASAYVPMIVLVVFGVLTMHSVTPSPSKHHAMPAVESLVHPVAHSEHDCPSGHQMMHPCAGTVTSWQTLPMPVVTVAIDDRSIAEGVESHTGSYFGRAPPWSLQGLDESVTLRV